MSRLTLEITGNTIGWVKGRGGETFGNNGDFKIYDEICHARHNSDNCWSKGYSQRLCRSQHNLKLSIITFFKQREILLRPNRCYLKSKLQQTLHRFSRT